VGSITQPEPERTKELKLLGLETLDGLLGRIQGGKIKASTEERLLLARRRKEVLALQPDEPVTFQDELANSGALTIADLERGEVDRIWELVESGKLKDVTNEQLLELARRRRADAEKDKAFKTSIAEELASEDVDGISGLELAGVTRIWNLVEGAALEISPAHHLEVPKRLNSLLQAPKVYDTTLEL